MSATSSEHDLKYYFEATYRNAEDYAEFMRTLEPGEESDIISSIKGHYEYYAQVYRDKIAALR